jgi:4-alpha-glucanotransferase
LMGDLPFLVSRDSADVWSHQHYFKLGLSSGAPPDAFFAKGQRWGMPPYDWPQVERNGFDYLIEKIRYAENFYDMFRIDHVVGTFRLWTIPGSEPAETHGLNGQFDPPQESEWEAHGRKLLSVMIQNTSMLPCAEDLGVVPECSYRTLWDFAVPGMDVQRWTKNWNTDASFKSPQHYRLNAMAILANHDMTSFYGWWAFEAGTVDEELFQRRCAEKGLDFACLKPQLFDFTRSHHGRLRWKADLTDTGKLQHLLGRHEDEVRDILEMYRGSYDEKNKFWRYVGLEGQAEESPSSGLLRAALEKASQTASVFNIQLLQDLLDLGPLFAHDLWEFRINFPGTSGAHNWSLVIPVSLEELLESRINDEIKKISEAGNRI